MKKLVILFSTAALLISSCGEQEQSLEAKKTELTTLKSELISLKGSIKQLEKELEGTKVERAILKVPVRVKTLAQETFHHYIEQPGTVSSKENVLVSAEMGGLITSVLAKEGDWVTAGTTIIQLDTEVMQNNVNELGYALALAKTTYERQESLWTQKIGSELQFLQIKNQYQSLENKFAAATAQLKKLNISAPISGTIEEVFLNTGELAAPGRPAFRIVNAENVRVEADVAERYSNILKKNTPVNIKFNSLGTSRKAKLNFIGQVINPANRTFKVTIELTNKSGELKPNSVASLEIRDFSSDVALVVPSEIVKKDMRGDYLFVAAKGMAKKTYITIGLSQTDKSMILEGLSPGDMIIIEGYNEVVGGSKLEIQN
tara:strand:- start:2148 stop:3269 length:1122 start_codon:yes stop_codon:yes gene_type:complete